MFNKTRKCIASMLAAAMLVSVGTAYAPGYTDHVVKAATAEEEGSEGLTEVDKLSVQSPDGKVSVKIWKNDSDAYYYSAYLDGKVIIQCSAFGLITDDADLNEGMTLDTASIKVVDGKDDYDLVQGPVNHVNKEWKELDFALTKDSAKVTMNFRVSNDGLAYRYNVDANINTSDEAVAVTSENSSFVLPDNTTLWTNDYSSTYEGGRYTERTIASVKSGGGTFSTPVLAETPSGWVLLSEASVYNNETPYCASVFQSPSGKKDLKVKFGKDLVNEDDMCYHGKYGKDAPRNHKDVKKVEFNGEFSTPWRAIIMGSELGDITKSTMISDLNPPAEGDFSWVVPGTSVWSWWSTSSDNIDYDSMKDYIDFCSNAGITYCLVDFGWENWDDYETKVKGLIEYANERNVGLLLWYGVHKWDNPHIFDLDNPKDIEEQFSWCEKIGVKGVKVDYLESDSQYAMKNMYWILESAARHHLVVNFHGCTDPNGENRTFPNLLSSEAVCGMEYFKWSNASAPETLVTLPFTRNVIGSMEYTPALMSLNHDAADGSKYSPATMGFMLSMCVTYESAVQTFAQSGYVYPGYNAFSLIADVPSTWDDSILVDGYPYSHYVTARRSGENWYVGAMTVPAKKVNIDLSFLDEGKTYNAYIYKDNEDGSEIVVEKTTVTKADTLSYDLLANGGLAMKITENDPIKWTEYDNYTFYEAEDAELYGKATIKDKQVFVSGKAWVEGLGTSSANGVKFTVNVPESGIYKFKPYIIAGNKRKLALSVNGTEVYEYKDIIGIAGDGGAVGNGQEIEIELEEGDNTIDLYVNSGTAPAIDRIAVSKASIADSVVTLSQTKYTYAGNACTPVVKVVRNGKTLTEGKEYEVFYSCSNKPGTATVYVTGINGYGGLIKSDYTIEAPAPTPAPTQVVTPTQTPAPTVTSAPVKEVKPGKVKITSLKGAKKQFKVVYKKVSGATGYQISYALNSKFKKAKTVAVKSNVLKKTIKKLKSKKTYYVRVRAIKKTADSKLVGAWSQVKKVKVK